MDNDARIAMLADTGVDRVCVLPFTRTFAALSPQDFLQKTFGETPPACLHGGRDFRFGVRAAGTVEELQAWGGAAALLAEAVKKKTPVCYEDLGPEAICRLEVENFYAIVGIDSRGNTIIR